MKAMMKDGKLSEQAACHLLGHKNVPLGKTIFDGVVHRIIAIRTVCVFSLTEIARKSMFSGYKARFSRFALAFPPIFCMECRTPSSIIFSDSTVATILG
jgi:hypothetical protein